ncbi:MAG: hypothetical protein KC656_23080, partial [Myxococcales bacterium]|nr:hypothetical protein [Myxococcales bacterium]
DLAVHLLGPRGTLPEPWVEERLGRLDRIDGDIETLMSRIAWIRTWTYVTYRDWIENASGWQERTRAIEDRLSDALHAALTARFVDRRAVHVRTAGDVELVGDEVRLDGVPLGRLLGLDLVVEPGLTRRGANRARAGLLDAVRARVEALEAAPDADLSLDDEHRVRWGDAMLGRLQKGQDLFEPEVVLAHLDLLDGAQKDRVRARIQRWVRATIEGLVAPLRGGKGTPRVRGLLYGVERGMGTLRRADVEDEVRALDEAERQQLARRNVRVGLHALYVPSTLKPARVRVRARLFCVDAGIRPTRPAPSPSATSVPGVQDEPFWWAIGFPVVGGMAVRADVLETCAAEVRKLAREGAFPLPPALVARLATTEEHARAFLRGLGLTESDGRFRATARRR